MARLPPLGRSFDQLRMHPLRTMLTLLGVVFGVGSVVAMVSIGEGAQQEILANIEAMGARNVHIQARPVAATELSEVVNESLGLSRADLSALLSVVPGISAHAYRATHSLKVSSLPGLAAELPVFGVSPELARVYKLRMKAGRPFAPSDHRQAVAVVILGASLAARVFPAGAIGQHVRLDTAWFEVVGVLAGGEGDRHGAPKAEGVDPGIYERAVLMPFETLVTTLAPPRLYSELDLVTLEVATLEQTLDAKAAVGAVLSRLHGKVHDYEIIAPEELLRQRKATQSVLNTVLVCIAAISLLVGGIGVMNIMLSNILERIPEIGLRRAIGARKRDIRNQFLLEALLICFSGGCIGVVLGFSIAFIVARVAGLPIAFAWASMILSFSISLVVGLVFGIVPAMRAANINPIEALRNE